MQQAFIGLGANLGELEHTLAQALTALAALPQTRLLAVSGTYRSAPVEAGGPDFLNAVAQIETALPPERLLEALLAIEQEHGRQRPFPNAPRTLDLDLLLYADLQLDTQDLTLPHPRLQQRAFVLLPLLELAPAAQVPGLGALAAYLPGVADQAICRVGPPPQAR